MSLQAATAAAAASLRCNRFYHGLLVRNGQQPTRRYAVMSVSSSGGSHHWHDGNESGGGSCNDRTRLMSRYSIHTYASSTLGGGEGWRREKDEQQQRQRQRFMILTTNNKMQKSEFHNTATNDKSAVALMLGFGALAAVSYAGAQGVKAYNEFMASLPPPDEIQKEEQGQEEKANNNAKEKSQQGRTKTQQKGTADNNKRRENIFKEWFGVSVGSKYYEGGFEDKMTKSEAALILGVRESSPTQRIKEAHKRLVVLNHPDTGGSTYMAGKINEAKELLLKGRMDK